MVIVFGHRGAPGSPRYGENTIASFRKALQSGAGGLEFDVRRCRDGQIVLIHDETVDRTTNGAGPVTGLTYEELKELDAGFGESIPLLSDVLDQFGTRCLLNIELKAAGLGADIRNVILGKHLEGSVIVSSFDWNELAKLTPEVPVGLLATTHENLIEAARQIGATAIHPRKDIVTPALVAAARKARLLVYAWTLNEPDEIAAVRDLEVDGIMSDFPERCVFF